MRLGLNILNISVIVKLKTLLNTIKSMRGLKDMADVAGNKYRKKEP